MPKGPTNNYPGNPTYNPNYAITPPTTAPVTAPTNISSWQYQNRFGGQTPAPTAAAPPSGGGPQVGDIDPSSSLRLGNNGQWLPQNFFSDLSGGGGGGDGGGGGGSGGARPGAFGPAAIGPASPGTPGVGPQVGLQPGIYPGVEMPDQMYGYIPEGMRGQFAQLMQSFLRGQGYQGQGNVGQYGERSFSRPGGSGPINFSPEMFNYFTDPALKGWMQWLFGARGLASPSPYPTG